MSSSNPFQELEQFFERMNRQFEASSRSWGTENPIARWTQGVEDMAIDLIEHDEEFVVDIDLPGYERDDVTIEVTDHTLRIEAEHEAETKAEGANYLRQERHHESLRRSITLPDEVDKEKVNARMANGVLHVTLPKLEVEAARQIEID